MSDSEEYDSSVLGSDDTITTSSSSLTDSSRGSFDKGAFCGNSPQSRRGVMATATVVDVAPGVFPSSGRTAPEQIRQGGDENIYSGFLPVEALADIQGTSGCSMNHMTDEILMEPYKYIARNKGKGVRGMLIDAFNATWLRIRNPTHLREVKTIVAALHDSSLLVDDIEDGSHLRRGAPAAHMVYGTPATLNCANYVYMMALQRTLQLQCPRATQAFTEEMLSLHRGQDHEIHWRDHCLCPTERDYEQMVLDKTGGLFRMAVRLLLAFSECKRDYIPLVNQLSLYFQIRDDYINLASDEYMKKKDFCEDLTEGKFSYPIIHCIRSDPNWSAYCEQSDEAEEPWLLSVLRSRPTDEATKRAAVQRMREAGSLAYTWQRLDKLVASIRKQIAFLGGNPMLSKLVDRLHVAVVESNASEEEKGRKAAKYEMETKCSKVLQHHDQLRRERQRNQVAQLVASEMANESN